MTRLKCPDDQIVRTHEFNRSVASFPTLPFERMTSQRANDRAATTTVRRWIWRLLLTAALSVAIPESTLHAGDPLADEISTLISEPRYRPSHWGMLVVNDGGEVVFEMQPDKLFVPASVTKCFSVAAAWDEFGPDHRFVTPVLRRGEVNSAGVLAGDLILVCTGDMQLGGRDAADGSLAFSNVDHTYANGNNKSQLAPADPLAGLNQLAKQIAAAGIKHVTGDVYIDSRYFPTMTSTGSGPTHVHPFAINDNLIDLEITPSTPGQPATVKHRPACTAFLVDANVITVAEDQPIITLLRADDNRSLVLTGQIPAGRPPLVRVYELPDPVSFLRSAFLDALHRAGVTTVASSVSIRPAGTPPTAAEQAALPTVAALTSRPFADSAKLILKVSHNQHASALPMLMAAKSGTATLAAGMAIEQRFLQRCGIDTATVSFGSGAGGSPADFVSPRATVQLMLAMRKRPDAQRFRDALPTIGKDGTLFEILPPESPAYGKVSAKTGTFYHENAINGRVILTSKALAGYVTTAKGQELTFALFVNNAHLAATTETVEVGKTLGRITEAIHKHR